MKQAKELDITVPLLDSFGAENRAMIEEFKEVSDGLIYAYVYDPASSDSAFLKKYMDRYDEVPDFTAANAYDSLKLLALAISEVGEDKFAVKEYLLSIEDYHGGSGVLSFDENGDVEKPVFIRQIQDGEFVTIK